MTDIKRTLLLAVRLIGVFLTVVIAYTLSTLIIGDTGLTLTPEEASRAGTALLAVSLGHALVLSFLILRSRWHGLKLIGAVFLIHLGVETLMTQIETLYFNRAVQVARAELLGLVGAGTVRALIVAPLAVLVLGRLRKPTGAQPAREALTLPWWRLRFAAVAALYPVIYFAFGYFVAWQWEATRLFYSGTTAIKPFLVHFWDLFLREDPWIVPFQLLRGAMWTALALLITWVVRGRRWEAALAVALVFVAFVALPLGLFPNPWMPDPVRQSHFYEIASSMLLFGLCAGYALSPVEVRDVAAPITQHAKAEVAL